MNASVDRYFALNDGEIRFNFQITKKLLQSNTAINYKCIRKKDVTWDPHIKFFYMICREGERKGDGGTVDVYAYLIGYRLTSNETLSICHDKFKKFKKFGSRKTLTNTASNYNAFTYLVKQKTIKLLNKNFCSHFISSQKLSK